MLKHETIPIQAKYRVGQTDVSEELAAVRNAVEALDDTGEKIYGTPKVGHELFRIGNLTDKVQQFHLLASGNHRPETPAIYQLYQLTVGAKACIIDFRIGDRILILYGFR